MSKRNPVLGDENKPKLKTKADKPPLPVKQILLSIFVITVGLYFFGIKPLLEKRAKVHTKKIQIEENLKPAPVVVKAVTLKNIQGNVLLSGDPATNGMGVEAGSVIETLEASTVVIEFSVPHQVKIRLTEKTKVYVEEILSPYNLFHLQQGAIYLDVKESEAGYLKFKSTGALFTTNNTQSFILTDGDYSLIAIQTGDVKVENFKVAVTKEFAGGRAYLVNKNGNSKSAGINEIESKLDWLAKAAAQHPSMSDLVAIMGDLSTQVSKTSVTEETIEQKSELAYLKESVEREIAAFEVYNQQLSEQLSSEKSKSEQDAEILKHEFPKIKNDLACLEENTGRCRLYSEKLLASRGFPTTFGSPRIRESIIVDLHKYIDEQDKNMAHAKQSRQEGLLLLQRRIKILKWAKESLASHAPLKPILDALSQKTLFR